MKHAIACKEEEMKVVRLQWEAERQAWKNKEESLNTLLHVTLQRQVQDEQQVPHLA